MFSYNFQEKTFMIFIIFREEGHLTKAPSSGLQEVARMLPGSVNPQLTSGLGDFFMVGVQPTPEDRTVTPSKQKAKKEDIKVSYKCMYIGIYLVFNLPCRYYHVVTSALG